MYNSPWDKSQYNFRWDSWRVGDVARIMDFYLVLALISGKYNILILSNFVMVQASKLKITFLSSARSQYGMSRDTPPSSIVWTNQP